MQYYHVPNISMVMDIEVLKSFVGKICFRTDLGRQTVLPHSPPSEIKRYINDLFHTLGTVDGGIVANGDIDTDVPLENIEAMYGAFLEFEW